AGEYISGHGHCRLELEESEAASPVSWSTIFGMTESNILAALCPIRQSSLAYPQQPRVQADSGMHWNDCVGKVAFKTQRTSDQGVDISVGF
ncbi:hypothetical protein BGZ67_000602, partial [Mortierella alpina]